MLSAVNVRHGAITTSLSRTPEAAIARCNAEVDEFTDTLASQLSIKNYEFIIELVDTKRGRTGTS